MLVQPGSLLISLNPDLLTISQYSDRPLYTQPNKKKPANQDDSEDEDDDELVYTYANKPATAPAPTTQPTFPLSSPAVSVNETEPDAPPLPLKHAEVLALTMQKTLKV